MMPGSKGSIFKDKKGHGKTNTIYSYRERFYIPEGTIYMDGNSLGLLSKDSEESLMRVINEWKNKGIKGWMEGESPWFMTAERIGAMAGKLVGADDNEVVHTGTTTVNIHTLTGSFFKPEGGRNKILADELNFPSDLYALKGQLILRGLDPSKHLLLAGPDSRGLLDETSIIEKMDESVALIFLPSVLYRSGQLLDMERLTGAANERGIPIGFDCSHSAGVIPHQFKKWGVDFALWCSYKYLNGGPGAPAFLYVNKKHHNLQPSLPGWFGNRKDRQFEMNTRFIPAQGAGRWQISSTGVLGSAPVEGAIKMILEAGIDRIREVSLQFTDHLIKLLQSGLMSKHNGFSIITPHEPERRGGHVGISHPEASRLYETLFTRGIVTDLRPPDIIRIAPAPLYNTYEELEIVVDCLAEIMDGL